MCEDACMYVENALDVLLPGVLQIVSTQCFPLTVQVMINDSVNFTE